MTVIHSLPDEHAVEFTSRGQGNPTQHKAKWLYELERAQWKQQPTPKSTRQSSLREAVTDIESGSPKSIRDVSESVVGSELSPRVTQARQAKANSALPTLPLSYIPVVRGTAESALPVPATASTLHSIPYLTSRVATPGDNPAATTSGFGTFSIDRRWEKQRAHMEEKEGQLSLWLRDTRINESQGVQLAIALKKHFAELGKQLARFTLNGKLLSSGCRPPNLTLNHQMRRTS